MTGSGAIGRTLLAWYRRHRRELPWRTAEPDPYAVWISEVMLQQTRAATVTPYYHRWMRRFPDLRSLAAADLEDVLRSWEGLGYYSRARNLHAAARRLCDAGEASLPRTARELRGLPGIGAYTAGAVASIAFAADEPAVDANARRVLSRYYDLPAAGTAELERLARSWLVPGRAGDVNQAIMDLGATVCTPRTPSCDACPLAAGCRARRNGTVDDRPVRRTRLSAPPQRRFAVLLAVDAATNGRPRTLLRRRDADGLLGGLWGFPARRIAGDADPIGGVREIERDLGLRETADSEAIRRIASVRHAYTHFTGLYEGVLHHTAPVETAPHEDEALRWAPLSDVEGVPMGRADRRLARALRRALSGEPTESVETPA